MPVVELELDELVALGDIAKVPVPESVRAIVGRLPAPPLPSAQETTLATAMTATDTVCAVQDRYPAQEGTILVCDTERMIVLSIINDHNFHVLRGMGGTTAALHTEGDAVSMAAAGAPERAELKVALALEHQSYGPVPV